MAQRRQISFRFALGQSGVGCQPPNQLHSYNKNCEVIKLPDDWYECRNDLHGAEKIAPRAGCNYFGVPRYLRMSEQQGHHTRVANQKFEVPIPFLCLCPKPAVPIQPSRNCAFAIHETGARLPQAIFSACRTDRLSARPGCMRPFGTTLLRS